MSKLRLGSVLFLFVLAVGSCEKDDICVDADTPLLVIDFYDVNDTTTLKNVTDLRIAGFGKSFTVDTFSDRSDLNTVSIPLRTNEDTTTFLMISNSATDDNGNETGNIDTLAFSYTRLEDFASRGCGFVVTYDNLTDMLDTGNDNWIQDIIIVSPQVIKSDTTHVKIFH